MDERDPVDRILDAAGEVFSEHGVEKSRMGQIADGAACSRATLYRYFATKELLVESYAMRELETMSRLVVARISDEPRLGHRLTEAIAFAIETTRRTPSIRPFLEPSAQGVTLAIPTRAMPMRPTLLAMLLAVATDHDGHESLRDDLPAEELLEWIVRLVLSLSLVPGPERSGKELREFVGRLVRPGFVSP